MLHLVPFFLVLELLGVSSSSCPPDELISPICMCKTISGDSMMSCNNVVNAEELIAPILSTVTNRYSLFSLEIRDSSLLFIPHDLLNGTMIQYIRFENCQLMSLSDTDIAFEGLEDTLLELRAEASDFVSDWDWQQLRNLKKLKLIDVHHIQLGEVSKPFPPLKEVSALGLSESGISYIVDDAFANLTNLQILVLKGNSVERLARNMFPNPANKLFELDLSDNELQTLPEDIFEAMPSLENVFLDNNRFTTLNEAVFNEPLQRLSIMSMNGNKLTCDCRIKWIVSSRTPYEFYGICDEPPTLAGRDLRTLDFKELWC